MAGEKAVNLNYDTVFVGLTATKEPAPENTSLVGKSQFQVSNVAVTAVDFGEISQKESVLKTITIKNISTSSLTAQNVSLSGTDFIISYDACSGKVLPKGSACSLKVTFSGAGKEGSLTSTLSYGDLSAALSGKVVTPAIAAADPNSSLKPNVVLMEGTSIAGTTKDLGTLTPSQSIIVALSAKNTGNLAALAATATLSDTSAFKISYNQCSNVALAVNASCSIKVTFSAAGKTPGSYTSTLSFSGKTLTLSANISAPMTKPPTPTVTISVSGENLIYTTTCHTNLFGLYLDIFYFHNDWVHQDISQNQGGGVCVPTTGVNGLMTITIPISEEHRGKLVYAHSIEKGAPEWNDSTNSDFSNTAEILVPCSSGTHFENESCVADTRACLTLPENAMNGQENYESGIWGTCQISECNSGFDISDNSCVAVSGNYKSLIVTYSGTGGNLSFSPSPHSIIDLGNNKIRYEFSENSNVTISGPTSGNIRLDYFSGDCSGSNCSLSLDNNKAILASFKDISNKFTFLDVNTNPIPTCIVPNGEDIIKSGIDGYKNSAVCESPKSVTWNEFDCGSYSDQYSCQDGTNYRCYWDDMGGGGGGGGNDYMCQMMFGGDEYMCNMEGYMYGCSFDYNMWSCRGSLGGGTCQGGYQAFCYDEGQGSEIPQISSGSDCTPEGTTGVFAYSTDTYGSVSSSDSINQLLPIFLNNKVYYFGRKNHTESSTVASQQLIEIDSTNNIRVIPSSSGIATSYISRVAVVNNKIYYVENDYYNSNGSRLQMFDGTTVQDLGSLTNVGSGGGIFNLNNELLIVGHNGIARVGANNVIVQTYTGYLNNSSGAGQAVTKDYFYSCLNINSSIGRELYKIDINGTITLVKEINPGYSDSCATYSPMRVLDYNNNKIAFVATSGLGNTYENLWYSDGTNVGTYTLHGTNSTNGGNPRAVSYYSPFLTSWNSLIFASYYGSANSSTDLFGVSSPWLNNSSYLISDIPTGNNPVVIGEVGGKVIYVSHNYGTAGVSLMGVTSSGVVQSISSIPVLNGENTVPYSTAPTYSRTNSYGAVVNNKLYFPLYGKYLYVTDGTTGGTLMIKDYAAIGKRVWYAFPIGNKIMVYTDTPGSTMGEMEIYDPSL